MPILSDIEVQRELGALSGWTRKGNEITKTFTFDGFPASLAFAQKLVAPAEAMNHHPDVDIRYNKVTVRLSTHDQGGITAKDFALAKQVQRAGE
jgi:4a-hydroxytetrahydrobiopterin dehydratase